MHSKLVVSALAFNGDVMRTLSGANFLRGCKAICWMALLVEFAGLARSKSFDH
jgi:hypothetical protein